MSMDIEPLLTKFPLTLVIYPPPQEHMWFKHLFSY